MGGGVTAGATAHYHHNSVTWGGGCEAATAFSHELQSDPLSGTVLIEHNTIVDNITGTSGNRAIHVDYGDNWTVRFNHITLNSCGNVGAIRWRYHTNDVEIYGNTIISNCTAGK